MACFRCVSRTAGGSATDCSAVIIVMREDEVVVLFLTSIAVTTVISHGIFCVCVSLGLLAVAAFGVAGAANVTGKGVLVDRLGEWLERKSSKMLLCVYVLNGD